MNDMGNKKAEDLNSSGNKEPFERKYSVQYFFRMFKGDLASYSLERS